MDTFSLQSTQRSEMIDITAHVMDSLKRSGVKNGLGVVYLLHTTAGLTINDHLDPAVAQDILLALERAVPRDQAGFRHGDKDRGGPFIGDTLAMGQAFIDLYAATGNRDWLTSAAKAGDFIANHLDSARA